MAMKFAAISLALMLLLTSAGAGVAYAAQDSLPNEALYPLKIKIEDLSVKLSGSESAQFQQMLKQIDERVNEIGTLAAMGEPVSETVMNRLQSQLSLTLQLAAGMTNTDMLAALNRYRTSLMTQEQQMMMEGAQTQSQNKNQGQVNATLEQVRLMLQQHRQAAESGLQDPAVFRIQTQNGNLWGMPETLGPAGPPDVPAQGENPGFGPGPEAGQPETSPGNPGSGNGENNQGEQKQSGGSNQKGPGGNP